MVTPGRDPKENNGGDLNKKITERIVVQWADDTLFHYGVNKYELVPSCHITGYRITAKNDTDALEQCRQLTRNKKRK